MSQKSFGSLLHYLQRIAYSASAGAVRDGELLRRFGRERDQAAFELLVWRHGPMVWSLCRRLLHHEQDAEDAFQATFLALARKAASIAKQDALASWLYKVAYRVACRSRRKVPACSNGAPALAQIEAPEAEDGVVRAEVRSELDREISGLPERYRRVIVLCYFEGKTHEEAAHVLRCPKGTVAARLSRARERLGRRLKRRGWLLSAGAVAGVLAEQASAAALPANLTRATVQAALGFAAGNAACAGAISANAVSLTEGVLRMFWYSNVKMLATGVLAVLLTGTGAGLAVRHSWAGAGPQQIITAPAQPSAAQGPRPQAERTPTATTTKPVGGNEPAGQSEVTKLQFEIKRLQAQLGRASKEIAYLKSKAMPGSTSVSTDFDVIRLRHADANDIGKILTSLFPGQRITILAQPATNSLLVRASDEDMKKIRELALKHLDTPADEPAAAVGTKVLRLKYARAADVANVLTSVYGGRQAGRESSLRNSDSTDRGPEKRLSIIWDDSTNSLVLVCSRPKLDEIEALVNRLERAARESSQLGTRLIRLKNASAADVAKVLREIYHDAGKPATFSADARSNRLIIRCPPSLAEEVDSLVRELDVK